MVRSTPEVFLTTSTLSRKLSHMGDLSFSSTAPPGRLIPVLDSVHYQRIAGIGAAMTDASAWLIEDQLPAPLRARVLNALFGADGIRLSFLRVPIAASGMTLPAAAEAAFVAQYLAPALSSAGLATKIYGGDNSWDKLVWGLGLFSGPAAPSLAGLAWHCYFGPPAVMSAFHRRYPSADQIVDECSPEIRPLFTAELLISSLRNWASSVAVWNLALDPAGGPVQPPNSGCRRCGGVITIDERTHSARFEKKFFQLGQVSKFVQPGAFRIPARSYVSYSLTRRDFATASRGLDDVAFLNPDGSKVLVAYNNDRFAAPLAVRTRGRYFGYRLPGRAMATFVWDRAG